MLILQRKQGESVFIGEKIQVTVVSVEAGRVRLAIEAPRALPILRSELRAAADTNQEAAREEVPPTELLGFLEKLRRSGSPEAGRGTATPNAAKQREKSSDPKE